MSTLLLRLAGPMQSWGTQSRFRIRETGLEPSKSGVVGLVCAALGRPRHEPVDDLARLRVGVRVDREGTPRLDYHTAGGTHRRGEKYGVAKADGSQPVALVSSRYYLADADFLVGLQGEDSQTALLEEIHAALARPRWQLFLGRKAFVPGLPVWIADGLRPHGLEQALAGYPMPQADGASLRLVLETDDPESGDIRQDQPVGAAYLHREFTTRYVVTSFLQRRAEALVGEE